jgi:hypothetical protein
MHFVIDVLETLLDLFLKLMRAAGLDPAQLFRIAGFRAGTPSTNKRKLFNDWLWWRQWAEIRFLRDS